MKNYRLTAEEPHAFTIHDGESHFKIAKHGLGTSTIKSIRALPKFTQGGGVSKDDSLSNYQYDTSSASASDLGKDDSATDYGAGPIGDINKSRYENAAQDKSLKQEDYAKMDPKLLSDTVNAMAPEDINPEAQIFANNYKYDQTQAAQPSAPGAGPTPASVPGAPDASAAPQGPQAPPPPDLMGQYKQAMGQQQAGMQAGAKAQQALAAEQAKIYGGLSSPEDQKALTDQLASLQQDRKRLSAETDDLQQKAMNNKIDPNRIYGEGGSHNKIAAAIGIMVAGMGAGRGPNQALGVINNTIDRDVEAQKADNTNNMNMYKLNLDRYKDNVAAEAATRVQLNAVTQGQLMAAAAKNQNPAIQAQLDQNLAALKMKSLQDQSQLYQSQLQIGMKRQLQGGGTGQINPELLDKDTRERLIPTANGMKLGYTKEDATDTKKAFDSLGTLNTQTSELQKLSQTNNYGIHIPGTEARAQYESLTSSLTTELNKLQGLNRLNENEYKEFGNMIPEEREMFTHTGQAKLAKLNQMIKQKMNEQYANHVEGAPQIPTSERPATGVRSKGP